MHVKSHIFIIGMNLSHSKRFTFIIIQWYIHFNQHSLYLTKFRQHFALVFKWHEMKVVTHEISAIKYTLEEQQKML